MTGTEIVRAILERESLSPTSLSLALGRERRYISTLLSKNHAMKINTLLEICDKTGYELVIRSKEDGYEFDL